MDKIIKNGMNVLREKDISFVSVVQEKGGSYMVYIVMALLSSFLSFKLSENFKEQKNCVKISFTLNFIIFSSFVFLKSYFGL